MVTSGRGFHGEGLGEVGEAGSRWGYSEPHRNSAMRNEFVMNYKLNIENESYPVEDIHIPLEATLATEPIGQPFLFVSPVRLTIGQRCVLCGDSSLYQLLVNTCFGFTYTPQFLVSGIIAAKGTAVASAS